MTDVLIYGDTVRHPELRHEVPLTLGDPFLYAEKDGRKHIVITDFEWPRVQEAGVDAELISPFALGLDELSTPGKKYWQIALEIDAPRRAGIGITKAIVPHTFPAPARQLPARERRSSSRRTASSSTSAGAVKNDAELAGHPPRPTRGRSRNGRRPRSLPPRRAVERLADASTASR